MMLVHPNHPYAFNFSGWLSQKKKNDLDDVWTNKKRKKRNEQNNKKSKKRRMPKKKDLDDDLWAKQMLRRPLGTSNLNDELLITQMLTRFVDWSNRIQTNKKRKKRNEQKKNKKGNEQEKNKKRRITKKNYVDDELFITQMLRRFVAWSNRITTNKKRKKRNEQKKNKKGNEQEKNKKRRITKKNYVDDDEFFITQMLIRFVAWLNRILTNKKRKKRNEQKKNKKGNEQEKNKKRRITEKNYVDDDDLVITQILSKLPVKSLMRFKSVSKSWQSVIERDSHFINLHRVHSQSRPPQLLIIVLNKLDCLRRRGCFDLLPADLDFDGGGDVQGATINNQMKVRATSPNVDVLGPVRGLLCFVDYDNFKVLIYNVTTREAVTPWIRSSMSLKKLPLDKLVCQFGFDPDTGEYKVIFIWHDSSIPAWIRFVPACCEVLTVGVDYSWRIIDIVPGLEVKSSNTTYVNGSIYWMCDSKDSLVAFDIGSEKFRMIRIPKFVHFRSVNVSNIMELDGCLTIMSLPGLDARKLKLWKFHDRNKNGTSNTTVGRSEREDWCAVSIKLPRYIFPMGIVLHQIPGKDQIILESFYGYVKPNVKRTRFDCYNRINKSFSEFKIQGIPSLPDGFTSRCKLLVECLSPVATKKPVKKLPSKMEEDW